MDIRKNVFFAAVFSLVCSLTFSLAAFPQVAFASSPPGNASDANQNQTGLQKLDIGGAPGLLLFTTHPAPAVKPAGPSTKGTHSGPALTAPAVETVIPGTSPDITPKQIEQFLTDHGMSANQAQAASNPTPAMLDEEFNNIWTYIAQSYYNGDKLTNWQIWRAKYNGKLKTRDDLSRAVTAMLASLDDRWTTFTSYEEMLQNQALAKTGLLYLGIGLAQNANGTFRVEVLEYDSPAWNTNLVRPGDIVKSVTIGSHRTTGAITTYKLSGMTKEGVDKLLVGKKGDKVSLVISHEGQDDNVEMVFDQTPDEKIEVDMLPNHIGYVRLPSFGTSEEEADALGDNFLKSLVALDVKAHGNLAGLVLDLRANHGGAVDLAKKIARIFIDHGTFLQTQERDGGMDKFEKDVFRSPMPYEYIGATKQGVALLNRLHTVPMTVLVDGSSASSAEILTGSLKDNQRAMVIGTQTFGKAVAFVRIPLSIGMLQVTSMHYLTPNGYDLANKGIHPDIVLERGRGAHAVDEQLAMAAQIILAASSNLIGQPDANTLTQGGDDDSGGENLLVIGLGLGLMLLIVVLTHRHFKLRRARDEHEKKDRK